MSSQKQTASTRGKKVAALVILPLVILVSVGTILVLARSRPARAVAFRDQVQSVQFRFDESSLVVANPKNLVSRLEIVGCRVDVKTTGASLRNGKQVLRKLPDGVALHIRPPASGFTPVMTLRFCEFTNVNITDIRNKPLTVSIDRPVAEGRGVSIGFDSASPTRVETYGRTVSIDLESLAVDGLDLPKQRPLTLVVNGDLSAGNIILRCGELSEAAPRIRFVVPDSPNIPFDVVTRMDVSALELREPEGAVTIGDPFVFAQVGVGGAARLTLPGPAQLRLLRLI